MTTVNLTTWTCNRDGRTAQTNYGAVPTGWTRLDQFNPPNVTTRTTTYDLCDTCSADFIIWMGQGGTASGIPINWLFGSNFETAGDEAAWSLVAGTGSISRVTGGSFSGIGNSYLSAGDTGTSLKKIRYGYDILPVVVGGTYAYQAWVTCSGSGVGRLNMRWMNGATLLSTSNGATTSITGDQRLTMTGTAPASTTALQVEVEGLSTTNGSLWVDAAMVEPGSVANTYTSTWTDPNP